MELKKLNCIDDVFRSPNYSDKSITKIEELTNTKFVNEFFVDKTGLGQETETALTVNGFKKAIQELLNLKKNLYSCITGEGQFQVYVAVFEK